MAWMRTLGSTGIEVSALGLGTVKLGRDRAVKYPQPFTLPGDEQARALLDQARALGINLLDTAPAYGNSETRLGEMLKAQRDQWVLCSKVGEEYEGGHSQFDFSASHVRRSVERSLTRLQTDVLDLVTIHSNGDDMAILGNGETVEELRRLQDEGMIRAVGMSAKTLDGIAAAAASCDVVMATLNPAEQAAIGILKHCREQGVGVLLKKPLASGHLAGGAGSLQSSLALAMAHCGTGAALVGTLSPAHLEQNVLITKGLTG